MTSLLLRVNTTAVDSSYAVSPGNFQTILAGDSLIFSAGSATVIDGAAIPNQIELNKAATILSPISATVVAHYFLADSLNNLLKEIHLAGNLDKQYVFCASFDGETASEPQLEAWDDTSLSTYVLGCLGVGIPAASWYKASCTTLASANPANTGIPLAGSGVSNVVLLNSGSGPVPSPESGFVTSDLYFNFCVKIPAAYTTPGSYLPVLVISYTTN